MVALWIKTNYYPKVTSDIIISDHMNNGELICNRIQKTGVFNKCFFCKTKDFSYGGVLKELSIPEVSLLIHRHPDRYIKKFFDGALRYRRLFISNIDYFAQILFDACSKKTYITKLYIFEDGMATYTQVIERCYNDTKPFKTDFLRKIYYKMIYNKKSIYGNVSGCYLFNPNLFNWSSYDFPLIEMKKINIYDKYFVSACNKIFGYTDQDKYTTQYIFLEESYFADGFSINDCEIVEKISEKVGKENVFVKIHPRNPINRFQSLGYKTNKNTSIPWEVIAMNQRIDDKTILTICSSGALNLLLIFGMKIKIYSIYNLIKEKQDCRLFISNEYWSFIQKVFEENSEYIVVCDSLEDIPLANK